MAAAGWRSRLDGMEIVWRCKSAVLRTPVNRPALPHNVQVSVPPEIRCIQKPGTARVRPQPTGHSTIRAALIYLHSTSTWPSLADTVTARTDSELAEADEPRRGTYVARRTTPP